jgi:hypothetical protein
MRFGSRLRRRVVAGKDNKDALTTTVINKTVSATPPPRPLMAFQDLRAVTLVRTAEQPDALSRGLVWSNDTRKNGGGILLSKVSGDYKQTHPALETGLVLVSINNESFTDAMDARVYCEESDDATESQSLTFLLWKPETSATKEAALAASYADPDVWMRDAGEHKSMHKSNTNTSNKFTSYVTACIFKESLQSKTGIVLQTLSRGVRITRVTPEAPPQVRPGMRLVAVNNASWFRHHSEAVALIRSLPAGYVTMVFCVDDDQALRSNSLDAASVAMTMASTVMAEDESVVESISHHSSVSNIPTASEAAVYTTVLTPDQAHEVVLTEDAEETILFHTVPPQADSLLHAGMRLLAVDNQIMASAGHAEHYLQTAEDQVTLLVSYHTAAAAPCPSYHTATAYRVSVDTKTGLVLTNEGKKVVVARVLAAQDSLFPTLQPGMTIVSINNHRWFKNFQEAIVLIRSIEGCITVLAEVATPAAEEEAAPPVAIREETV